MALLRLLFKNVVQPIQLNGGELHGVPDPEGAQNSRVCHCRQRAKCDKPTDAQVTIDDLDRANPQENCSGKETYALQDAVPRHHNKTRLKKFLRDGKKLV